MRTLALALIALLVVACAHAEPFEGGALDAGPDACAACRKRCAELDASTAIPVILCSFDCDLVCSRAR